MRQFFQTFVLICSLALLVNQARAQGINTFIGSLGNWNNPGNWSMGTVPTAADTVIIPSFTNVTINGSGTCSYIHQVFGSILTLNSATLTIANLTEIESGTVQNMNGTSKVLIRGKYVFDGFQVLNINGIASFTTWPEFPILPM